MDIEELRKHPSVNQTRIAELKKQQSNLLKEQKERAVEWNNCLQRANVTQRSNIRGMKKAVFLSLKLGCCSKYFPGFHLVAEWVLGGRAI